MEYTFSWAAFLVGIIVLLVGAALAAWNRPIADNFGSGLGDYDRYRMWGLIVVGAGFIIMVNLHTVILTAILGMFFNRG